jgi:hypothetical protein
MFVGIESGSTRVQRAIEKRLDLDDALAAIRNAHRHRIKPTISLIAGFPEETADDLRATLDFLFDSLRLDGVKAQLHVLAPLAGTTLYEQYRDRLEWDGLFSDMAFQGWRQDPDDRTLIRNHPQIFPNFYTVPTACLRRAYLVELRDFIVYGLARFRWLMVALHQYSGSILPVFERWLDWRAQNRPNLPTGIEYHAADTFRSDFLEFVACAYLDRDDPEALAVATLHEYEIRCAESLGREAAPAADLASVPRVVPGVAVVPLSADYRSVIECLRNRQSPREVPRRRCVVVERCLAGGGVEVIELPPLAAALVRLCDGTRPVEEIAAVFGKLEGLDGFPPEEACLFSLKDLARQGVLVFEGG